MRRQPFRTETGGLIDRAAPLRFDFDENRFEGFAGDTLASALLANGVRLVGRSFKYHRPRGIYALGAEEPSALVEIGTGAKREPNARATTVELRDGLIATSQHCWPTLGFDLGAVNDLASRLLPAGFYYKTFMWPPSRWTAYERYIRRMAGLGRAPERADPDYYARRHVHVDVLVAGGGPAGLAAALAAARTGARVLLADEHPRFGGSLLNRPESIAGRPALDWIDRTIGELRRLDTVTLLPRATVAGSYDHGLLTIAERVTDHLVDPPAPLPRQRWWHVRARRVVLATGAIERPLVFADNDRPGVMMLGAARGYLHRYGVLCGRAAVLFTNNDSAYAAAIELVEAGIAVRAVADARVGGASEAIEAARAAGIRVLTGTAVVRARGRGRVRAAQLAHLTADGSGIEGLGETLPCDLIAVSGGWNPAIHLHSHARGAMRFDERLAAFVPDRPGGADRSVGACNGTFALADALAEGTAAGLEAARAAGFDGAAPEPPAASHATAAPGATLWAVPDGRHRKRFVDLQNDVTVADVELAAREGYRSVEHLKRYTTLGMGTDQGKLGNLHGLALLAGLRGETPGQVGTTTFRPPYTPVTFGAIGGGEQGEIGHPMRRTAADEWHAERGAVFTDAGGWRRPQFYPQPDGGAELDWINAEVTAVRTAVGLVDVATLGKLDIRGPDAAELLDRVYVNGWKTLAVGRGRYGVMLREDGRVFDDGVTMRLGEDRFHMTTTTGGAAAVYRHLERLLQVEWPRLRVFVTPVTEEWFAAALSGPRARAVLAQLTEDIDVSNEAFPMMAIRQGTVAGIPARVMRISYSGELSYEISVSADWGAPLWNAILAAGVAHGLRVYGTEAMGVLRIEKGHVTHAEADGRTTPHDLGLERMLSRTKDYVGRRSLDLPALTAPDRKQLVGLTAEEERIHFPPGAQVVAEDHGDAPRESLGHVTSHCWSPTVGRHIGLALVKGGRGLIGGRLFVTSPVEGRTVPARVGPPVFYDPEGTRLHA